MKSGHLDAAEQTLEGLPAILSMDSRAKTLRAELSFTRVRSEAPDEETLEKKIAADPDDLQARYQLSAHKVLAGEFEGALEQLLEIIARDRSFQDDVGRRGILACFELMDDRSELVASYRRRMAVMLH